MQSAPGLERRIVSVLFADLVGFTPLSEGLDPEDVATIQDAYFGTVREVMERHGGQVEKFIGDAVMAVFGMPRTRDDDAERAVAAGLALIGAVQALSAQLGLEEGRLQVRVGVNTGEVVSAESGPDSGRVTGDTVNVAARLQAAAPPSRVLVGDLTAYAVAATVALQPVEPLLLKGKSEPVRAAIATEVLPRRDRSRAMGSLAAPLIGRADDLERLVASVTATTSDSWLVVAPPGVGKTRLLSELARRVSDRVAVWRAQVPLKGASPFAPLAQLLLAALDRGGADGTEELRRALAVRLAAAEVAQGRATVVLDATMPLLQGSAGEAYAGVPDRDARFAAWLDLFEALQRTSAHGRALWLMEDLHWASPDLLSFLAAAASRRDGHAIVASARPTLGLGDPTTTGGVLEGFRRLELVPLAMPDAAALVRSLVGDALPEALVSRIVDRCDGNALFIEELLRSWIGVGILAPDEPGGWRLVGSPNDVSLPATVQAIYAGQLDDLPGSVRRLARRASVAGRRFVRESLAALDVDDPAALEDLRLRALLSPPQRALLGEAYAYRHALLRDAGYASLARFERADLHVRLALWLEQAAGPRAALLASEIAQHYGDALDALPALAQQMPRGVTRDELRSLAATWLERAAAQSIATAAPLTAAAQIRRALELTPEDDAAARARRWLFLAEAIGFSGNMDEAVAALDRALDLYRALLASAPATGVTANAAGTPDETGEARDGFARAAALRGTLRIEQLQFREAEAAASAALEVLGDAIEDLAAGRVRYLRAWARVAYSPAHDVRDDLTRALRAAIEVGDRRLELDASAMLDELRVDSGEIGVDEFLRGRERIFELGMRVGQVRRALAALRTIALLGAENGRPDARELLRQATELAEAHAATEDVAWAHYALSEVHFIQGSWDEAWRHGLAALEISEANAYHRPVVRTWSVLTAIAHAQGRREELERAYAWFDARRSTFPDSPFGRMMHGAVDARAAAHRLRPPFESDSSILDGLDDNSGLASWYAAVEEIVGGWIVEGRLDLAASAVPRMRRWERVASPLGLASTDLLEGQLLLARGDRSAAARLAGRALAAAERVSAAWWAVRATRLLVACAAATAEQRAAADSLAVRLALESERPAPPTS